MDGLTVMVPMCSGPTAPCGLIPLKLGRPDSAQLTLTTAPSVGNSSMSLTKSAGKRSPDLLARRRIAKERTEASRGLVEQLVNPFVGVRVLGRQLGDRGMTLRRLAPDD